MRKWARDLGIRLVIRFFASGASGLLFACLPPGFGSLGIATAYAQDAGVGSGLDVGADRVEGRSYVSEPRGEIPQELKARIDALQAQRDALDAATEETSLPEVPVLPKHSDSLPRMEDGDPNPDRLNAPSRMESLTFP